MLVNSGVARFQHYAHYTVTQIQDPLRAFQRVVGLSGRHQFVSFIEAMRQRVDFLLSQGKPLWRELRQRTDEALLSDCLEISCEGPSKNRRYRTPLPVSGPWINFVLPWTSDCAEFA
jgi:hypothetical protein